MRNNPLGRSGLIVSELCLGAMTFDEREAHSASPEDSLAMLDRFVEAGGNFIDTANVYGDGRSETLIGGWLKDRPRDTLVIATKVRFRRGDDPNALGLSRQHMIAEVENSLRRLQTDHIDLYYAHMWDPITPIEETMRAFDDLITAGKVRYIGVSNFKAWQVMKAQSVSEAHGYARFIAGQYQYSLVNRDMEYEFPDLFAAEGISSVPWGPLGGGFLSGKYKRGARPTEGRISDTPDHDEEAWSRRATERNWRIIDAVGAVAEARGKTYSQVALCWLLQQPTVQSVIIGVRTPAQLVDNLGAVGWSLSPEDLAVLESASALPELYPYRMLAQYGRR